MHLVKSGIETSCRRECAVRAGNLALARTIGVQLFGVARFVLFFNFGIFAFSHLRVLLNWNQLSRGRRSLFAIRSIMGLFLFYR